MKILHITTHFPPFVGGLENLVWQVAREQASRREVAVLTLKHDPKLPDFEVREGVRIFRVRGWEILENRWIFPRFGFEKKVREVAPEVIFTHTRFFATSFFGGRVARKIGARWVHVEHGSNFVRAKNRFVRGMAWIFDRIFGRWVLKNADRVMTLSEAGRDFVKNLAGREAVIVPNGVQIPAVIPPPPRQNRAIFFGRLIAEKGIFEVLGAARMCPEWKFEICGGGGNFSPKNEPKNVKFAGEVAPEAIFERVAGADLAILPSWSEGSSLAVLESAAVGRPVLATDVGENRKICSADFLVEAGRAESLAEKLRAWRGKFEFLEREGARVRTRVAERFSFEEMVARWEAEIF